MNCLPKITLFVNVESDFDTLCFYLYFAVTTLKTVTWVAETCLWLLCNKITLIHPSSLVVFFFLKKRFVHTINAGNMEHIWTEIYSLKYDVQIRKVSVSTKHRTNTRFFSQEKWLGKQQRSFWETRDVHSGKHVTFINVTQRKMFKTLLKASLVLKFRLELIREGPY